MRISVRQSGGFAGVEIPLGSVDTETLPADVAREIHSGLEQSGFSTFAIAADAPVGADFLLYQVEVEDEGRTEQVSFADDQSDRSARLAQFVQLVLPHLRL